MPNDDQLMTHAEAAAFLRQSQNTLYRWVNENPPRIPFIRPYAKRLYLKSDLLAYLRRQSMRRDADAA